MMVLNPQHPVAKKLLKADQKRQASIERIVALMTFFQYKVARLVEAFGVRAATDTDRRARVLTTLHRCGVVGVEGKITHPVGHAVMGDVERKHPNWKAEVDAEIAKFDVRALAIAQNLATLPPGAVELKVPGYNAPSKEAEAAASERDRMMNEIDDLRAQLVAVGEALYHVDDKARVEAVKRALSTRHTRSRDSEREGRGDAGRIHVEGRSETFRRTGATIDQVHSALRECIMVMRNPTQTTDANREQTIATAQKVLDLL